LVRVTLPVKEEMGDTVTVDGLLVVPWLTLMADGAADRLKSGGAGVAVASLDALDVYVPLLAFMV